MTFAALPPHCLTCAHHSRDQHKAYCRRPHDPAECPHCAAGQIIADPTRYAALRRRIRRQLARRVSAD